MKTRISLALLGLLPLAMPVAAGAQVPVDDQGRIIGAYGGETPAATGAARSTGEDGIPLLGTAELEELVGPIALYPDDLLAVVLPASTYPLQIVQAARFLEDLAADPTLEPDPDWDDSIVALINYPEALAQLNDDLDWTWRLGEAVVAQQADVLAAVGEFRNRAYAAGNLRSDRYQSVSRDEDVIEIMPVTREIMYVPYYEPERVVHYQPQPVIRYYPEPCPVYYYPYPSGYAFPRRHFWGVTTAFTIGWTSRHLRVFHHSYDGHPYFGVRYWDRWWYRRPPISVHNTVYVDSGPTVIVNRHARGDAWRPSRNARLRYSDQRITRSDFNGRRHGLAPPKNRRIERSDKRVHRSVVPARRESIVSRRELAVQPRDRAAARRGEIVQPRGRAGVAPRRPESANGHSAERVARAAERGREVRRQPSARASTGTARNVPAAQPRERAAPAARSGEPRNRPVSRTPSARTTERRSAVVERHDKRGRSATRPKPRVREDRQRR